MAVDVSYTKVCRCRNATASGPRIVNIEVAHDGIPMGAHWRLEWVTLACDRCNHPWVAEIKEG